jgi:hypothetical protein
VPARSLDDFHLSLHFAPSLFSSLPPLRLLSPSPSLRVCPAPRSASLASSLSRRSHGPDQRDLRAAMVSGAAHNPGGGAAAQTTQRSPPQLGARTALATPPPVSGGAAHSASTSGGTAGSPPSSRSEQHAPDGAVKGPALGTAPAAAAASTPASDSTFLRLNNLDINGDDAPSSQAPTRLVCANLCRMGI